MPRMFEVLDAAQRSEAWRAARLGRLTGTCAADMLATIKAGEAAARRDLRIRLAVERLTGYGQDDVFVNRDMQRGIDLEPTARLAYEARRGVLVHETGFLAHRELLAGCSLDGHIGDFAGIVEIKVPKSATHYKYLKARTVPPEYVPQIVHNLWISGAAWCDFVSFDDRFPPPLQLFVARVPREAVDLAAYELTARLFLGEVETECNSVQNLIDRMAA